MFTRKLNDCEEFTAGDNTILREIFNPLKDKELKLRYSLAHAIVKPGELTYKHKLKTTEVYYILQGKGLMFIDDEQKEVETGEAIYIPPNAVQQIKNIETQDLIFICMVDPAWKKEDEEILN